MLVSPQKGWSADVPEQSQSTKPEAATAARAKLPRGVNKLPRRVVLQNQRARLVEAMGHAVAEHGYADTTVGHVLAHAGVSRAAFYQLFKDKEDCYLKGLQDLSDRRLREFEASTAAATSLPEQLLASIRAYMKALDIDKRMTKAFVVEAVAATPAIRKAQVKSGDRLETVMLRDWHERVRAAYPEVPPCHALTLRALREAMIGVIVARIKEGGPSFSSDVNTLATLVFAALGLYRWARQSESGALPSGKPR